MVYTKDYYRYLVVKGGSLIKKKHKLVSFIVPDDFPLTNEEVKMIFATLDLSIPIEMEKKIELNNNKDLDQEIIDSFKKYLKWARKKAGELTNDNSRTSGL